MSQNIEEEIKPQLQEVFVLSGAPTYTFVEPVEYARLLVSLRTKGRSIVVEGPSGIGKTTAVINAISAAGISNATQLSARKRKDIAQIESMLLDPENLGTVVIDDFHRLSSKTKRDIADLMKTLADEGASHSKLVVIGITNAGQSLISFGRDLANRIEVIPFETNPDHKVEELIEKGELALNVSLNVRAALVSDSQGSFYIAQMLAYNTCLRAGVLEQSEELVETEESFHAVKAQVMEQLRRSFHDRAIAFARGTKLRREGRAPYLHLLHWLSQSDSWSINCMRETDRHPAQRGSVHQVVTKGFLADLISSSPEIQEVLHFDEASNTLVVQDPQFIFYIRNLSWHNFAEEVGFISIEFPSRYDFALSFAGEDRDVAQALFDALVENEVEVFYDLNEQHRILAADVEEYLAPIYQSEAQFVVCILGPTYPRKIWTKFESANFKERFRDGQVIPVVLSTTQIGVFDETGKVGYISWDRSKDFSKELQSAVSVLLQKCGDGRKAL
ncbi:ATPase [Roseateles chitinivorans]|uniref:ATPase n=1 Tax=Roseateles chitinivorans TaxID=2917965 RepID=A0A2G9C342_9BURK|nr:TIR domain-containing protein [Roseateles chitinivorans]PIM50807.1 ATPase [Roseateles chitinivorans]